MAPVFESEKNKDLKGHHLQIYVMPHKVPDIYEIVSLCFHV